MPRTLNPSFAFTETEGGGVLLDRSRGEYWQLNGIGAFLVSLVASGLDEQQIVERLTEEYPDAAASVTADVRRMLGQLEGLGAIADE